MPWVTGRVRKDAQGLSLERGPRRLSLIEGAHVELWRLAQWQRGQVLFSDFLNWYWSTSGYTSPCAEVRKYGCGMEGSGPLT